MFAKDGRGGTAHHIPKHTTAYTGHHTKEDAEKGIVSKSGPDGILYANHGKDTKTGGIKKVQKRVIDKLQGVIVLLPIGRQQKDKERCDHSGG